MVSVTGDPPDIVAAQLNQARQLSARPIGAHFFLLMTDPDSAPESVAAAADRAPVVDFFYADPDPTLVDIVHATRDPGVFGLGNLKSLIEYGASPRATIYLAICSRAHAFLRGRSYVLPEDVKAIGVDVLRHRIITSFEAEAEEVTAHDLVPRVFASVDVP